MITLYQGQHSPEPKILAKWWHPNQKKIKWGGAFHLEENVAFATISGGESLLDVLSVYFVRDYHFGVIYGLLDSGEKVTLVDGYLQSEIPISKSKVKINIAFRTCVVGHHVKNASEPIFSKVRFRYSDVDRICGARSVKGKFDKAAKAYLFSLEHKEAVVIYEKEGVCVRLSFEAGSHIGKNAIDKTFYERAVFDVDARNKLSVSDVIELVQKIRRCISILIEDDVGVESIDGVVGKKVLSIACSEIYAKTSIDVEVINNRYRHVDFWSKHGAIISAFIGADENKSSFGRVLAQIKVGTYVDELGRFLDYVRFFEAFSRIISDHKKMIVESYQNLGESIIEKSNSSKVFTDAEVEFIIHLANAKELKKKEPTLEDRLIYLFSGCNCIVSYLQLDTKKFSKKVARTRNTNVHLKAHGKSKMGSEIEAFSNEDLDGVNAIMNIMATWLLLDSMGVGDNVIADFVLAGESLDLAKNTITRLAL